MSNFLLSLPFRSALILAGGISVSLMFWHPLKREERLHVQHVIRALARSVKTDVSDEIRSQTLAQVRLARAWGHEREQTPEKWKFLAEMFLRHHSGYRALQWIDADFRVCSVATDAENAMNRDSFLTIGTALRQLLQQVAKDGSHDQEFARLSPAFRLSNGQSGRSLIVPILRDKNIFGFVIAVVDEEKVFQTILEDHAALGYAIVVFDDDAEVYRMRGTNPANEQEWAQDEELKISGATWRVRVWPSPELLSSLKSGLPQFGLAAGLLIGSLLFMMLDFGRTAYVKSHELLRIQNELEVRVQQRTSQLQSTNVKLEDEIHERRQAEESLQELSGRLLRMKDEEQRRLARELHDGTAQLLGALAINVEKLLLPTPNRGNPKEHQLLVESADLIEQAMADVRTISHLLHPPILDELGVEGALSWYTVGFSQRSGILVSLDVQPDFGRFNHEMELTFFRIVQEALSNIHRHSGSSSANIVIRKDAEAIMLEVIDHGRGFPPGILDAGQGTRGAVGVGITGMRERVRQLGGFLEIKSDASGTLIRATLPVSSRPSTPGQDHYETAAQKTRADKKRSLEDLGEITGGSAPEDVPFS